MQPTLSRKYADPTLFIQAVWGDNPSYSTVQKFGRNEAVGTTFAPIAGGGIYNTPQAGSATTLRIKAGGNANDTAAGSGAREVTVIGLDETGAEVMEALATNGTSASSATTATFMRVYRAYVSSSGTYASQSAGSHSAAITIENGAGGTDWLVINATDFPRGQTEIGAYSVPLGKEAIVLGTNISVNSNKTADVVFFQRNNILQTSAPYSAMRMVNEITGAAGSASRRPAIPFGPFSALTDFGFMAKAATSSEVEVSFEILLRDA